MKCLSPIFVKNPKKYSIALGAFSYLQVPCGKCYACLRNKQNAWVSRVMLEFLQSESTLCFVLTYDEDHLPKDGLVSKTDVQKFLKRLRHVLQFRYFIAAEYGSKSLRPHYHGFIFFQQPLTLDMMKSVDKAWHLGHVDWMQIRAACFNYTCKYVTKQAAMSKKLFMLSSRKPGIGFNFNVKKLRGYNEKEGTFTLLGSTFTIPRYLRQKFDIPMSPRDMHKFYFESHLLDDFTDDLGNIDFNKFKSVVISRYQQLKRFKDFT